MTRKIPIVSIPTAPAPTSTPVVLSTTPPFVSIPSPPAGFAPVKLSDYRGYFISAAQLGTIPDVVTELSNGATYTATFGPAAPPVGSLVQCLDNAVAWTTMRTAAEAFFEYARSQEAVAWKLGLTKIDQVEAIYQIALTQNAQLPETFPALARLLGVRAAANKRAAAGRKRTLTANAATAAKEANARAATTEAATNAVAITPATTAATAPLTVPAASSGTGGAGH
jgi:hypothetical protein